MAKLHACPLCGYEFDIEGMSCHTSCPLSAGCHILCCPNCGYQIPDQSQMRFASMLKSLWERYQESRHARAQRKADRPQSVTDLQPGQRAEVVEIVSADRNRLARLSSYGLMPGCQISLRQRSPAFVLAIDETEVALDTRVAREILVRVP
jgi:DtxR family Mn-dependent transcriptional regulator/ferrous iron transport protein A